MRWTFPAVFCLTLVAAAQPQLTPERIKQIREDLARPIVYSVPGMDKVRVSDAIVYRTDGDMKLLMKVYQPANLAASARRPVVFFLHGGANIVTPASLPTPIEWGVYNTYGQLMGASGLIGVTFNQRVGQGFDKGFADVDAAIQYMRAHAAEFHADMDRICLSAYSAGGPLLAYAIRNPQPSIRCLVGFYGVMNVQPSVADHEQYSPIDQLKLNAEKLPPILIARAGKDSAGLNATIDKFVAEALSRDVPIEVHNIKDAPHAFDILTPTAEVREVIARTVAFLKANLEK